MSRCAIVSFRLGLTDGVSIVAATWRRALGELGYDVVTVAGEGPVDRTVAGLAIDAPEPPSTGEVEDALADVDLVVVENLLTIPMNLPASLVVADVLRGRPALLHHHDPPWQRERYAHITALPPSDPAWQHVTINELTRVEMAARGIAARCIYNGFDPDPPHGDRDGTRRRLGVAPDEVLLAHPVRAIARKRVDVALRIAEQLDATYWLPGPAEEGYAPELERLLSGARCRVLREEGLAVEHLYAACDAVVFPSSWEGFGNPPVEAATHRRPAIVGDYPVAAELRALGFRWFPADDPEPVARYLRSPDPAILDQNLEVVRTQLSTDVMTERLGSLLADAGWAP
ncbi:glycosyltransferase family 4 protein [Actinomarinicola tropica]|uniref:Glycosyltransferase n=1 Tax=Actinomarinicola tropica TaxID=2789776 RepID=A0A5Q2RI13_9ACTN|nr:glycosyltransferase family 4 protein [Actinomarinicola tropica]QGG94522.1 glycosyltransferase [Actinomarinicola tropica]